MVTVIIPTYKRADFIKRAIDSVLNQTYSDIELIVVDDNDPNTLDRKNMEKIMKSYKKDKRVKYLKHKKNMNGSAARNTGIKSASGEFITFLDDDDFYLSNRIEELVNCLNNNKCFDAVYTGGFVISNNKIIDIFNAVLEGNLQYELLKQKPILKTGSNIFLRADVLREINGFDEDFLRHQDLEMMVRFFRNHRIKSLNSYTVVKDETSRINKPNIEKALKMKELYLEKYKKDIEKHVDKNQIYIENYKNLLLNCDKKNESYTYIKNKLDLYEYKINLFENMKNKLKKTFIKSIYSYLNVIRKSIRVDRNYISEVKKIIRKYKI